MFLIWLDLHILSLESMRQPKKKFAGPSGQGVSDNRHSFQSTHQLINPSTHQLSSHQLIIPSTHPTALQPYSSIALAPCIALQLYSYIALQLYSSISIYIALQLDSYSSIYIYIYIYIYQPSTPINSSTHHPSTHPIQLHSSIAL